MNSLKDRFIDAYNRHAFEREGTVKPSWKLEEREVENSCE